MYLASMRREAIEGLEARKLAMTTGFWANDGLNDDKGSRTDALENLEEQFQKAVELVYSGNAVSEEEENVLTQEDEDNPFLAPAIKATREIQTPEDSPDEMSDEVKQDLMKLDQT